MVREFSINIDGNDNFLDWLWENFDSDHDTCEFAVVPGQKVVHIKDTNGGIYATDLDLYLQADGRVAWFDENECTLAFSEGPVDLIRMYAELEQFDEKA